MSELDEIREELKTLREERTKSKKDWLTAPMIMAYIAIFGVVGTTIEDCSSRYELRSKITGEIEENKVVEARTQDVVLTLILRRIDDLEDRVDLYQEAVMEALPRHQRAKVEEYVDAGMATSESAHGIRVLPPVELDSHTPDPPSADSVLPPVSDDKPRELLGTEVRTKSLYKEIQQRATKGEVNYEELDAMLKSRK